MLSFKKSRGSVWNAMRWVRLRQLLFVMAGWLILTLGLLVLSIPVPLPFPLSPVLMLIGIAVLSAHSRAFRHWLRLTRHRHLWLSRWFDLFGEHAPRAVRTMVHRTRPALVERYDRRRSARAGA